MHQLFLRFLLLICTLLIAASGVNAQAYVCPSNIDFSFGNFTYWTCETGLSNCRGACAATNGKAPVFGNALSSGPIPGRHTLTYGSDTDKYVGFPVVAPGGGIFSVRVGSDSADYSASRIRYKVTIPVSLNNHSIQFRYAAVIKDPGGHAAHDRPTITIKIIDSATGLAVPCRDFLIQAGDPGFTATAADTSIKYSSWKLATLNLSGLAGRVAYIEVTSLSCGDGNHWAYCYFDPISCQTYRIAVTYCNMSGGIATIAAPPGYATYRWYRGSTVPGNLMASQQATINAPAPDTGTYYYCILGSAINPVCFDTLRSVLLKRWDVEIQPSCGVDSSTKYVWFSGTPPSAYTTSWRYDTPLPLGAIHGPDSYGRFMVDPTLLVNGVVLTITDSNGCFTQDSLKQRPKLFTLKHMQDTVTCPGTPVSLSVLDSPANLPYSYRWHKGAQSSNMLSDEHSKNSIYTSTQPGDHKLLVFVSAQGCESFDSVTVHTIDTNLRVNNDTVCQHSSIIAKLEGDSALHYLWSPSEGIAPGQQTLPRPLITVDTSRTYTITASHPNCPIISRQLRIVGEPNPILSLGADTLYKCPGIPITLKGLVSPVYTAYIYTWNSLASLTDMGSGVASYSGYGDEQAVLAVATPHGCNASDTQWIQASNAPLLTLDDSATIRLGNLIRLSPVSDATMYRWFPASSLDDPTASSPVAKPAVSTKYFVVASNGYGCSSIDSIYIKLHDEEASITLPNAFTPGREPNHLLKVLYTGTVQLRFFRVYNRQGTLVFETRNIYDGWDGSYQGSPQPHGVYIYTAEAVDLQSRKLVKTGNVSLLR
jgi:gliding motility-associated-like protein